MKTEPRKHQAEVYEWLEGRQSAALFHAMRTGKSKIIIDDFNRLFQAREINAALVIAPNGVHSNWVRRELPAHQWDDVRWGSWEWNTPDKQSTVRFFERWKERAFIWYCVPTHAIRRDDLMVLLRRIVSNRKVAVVFDESHDFAQPGSQQTRRARWIAKQCKVRRIVTGSPVENKPLQAYSQFELLEPGCLGFTRYDDFKQTYAIYERGMKVIREDDSEGNTHERGVRYYPKLVGYQNLDDLQRRIAPYASVVTRDQIDDIPDLVRSERWVTMAERQAKIYDEIKRGIVAEIDEEKVDIGSQAPKFVKLQQILSGFLIDKSYAPWTLKGRNPRLEALVEEVTLNDGKVIVWCAFQRDIDSCVEALRKAGREVVEYHGRTTMKEKERVRGLMGPDSDPYGPDMVGHPRSGGLGLNLSGATKIIWYSHTFDAILRLQADERATEIRGNNVPVVDFVAWSPNGRRTIDQYILNAQADKTDLAEYMSRDGLRKVIDSL